MGSSARQNGFASGGSTTSLGVAALYSGVQMVSHLQWLPALKEEPLDRNGPVEIPFEPFESPWITIPICERFDQIAARHFDKVAVDDGDSSLTFGEIQRASLVLACNIEAHVPSGRPIGILLKRSVFFL